MNVILEILAIAAVIFGALYWLYSFNPVYTIKTLWSFVGSTALLMWYTGTHHPVDNPLLGLILFSIFFIAIFLLMGPIPSKIYNNKVIAISFLAIPIVFSILNTCSININDIKAHRRYSEFSGSGSRSEMSSRGDGLLTKYKKDRRLRRRSFLYFLF